MPNFSKIQGGSVRCCVYLTWNAPSVNTVLNINSYHGAHRQGIIIGMPRHRTFRPKLLMFSGGFALHIVDSLLQRINANVCDVPKYFVCSKQM